MYSRGIPVKGSSFVFSNKVLQIYYTFMLDKFPSLTYVYDRRKKATPRQGAIIELRITYNKKQKYLSTGISVLPHQWKNGKIINCPDAPFFNQFLDKLLFEVRQVLLEMYQQGNIDIYAVKKTIEEKSEKPINFIEYCEKRASIRKYGYTERSQERYDLFIKHFKQWGKIIEFEDITERNIIKYDSYLIKQGLKASSKWNNYHRFLNSFIMDAIDDGFISKNPYKWLNIDKDKEGCIGRYLSPDEFRMVKAAFMPTESLERVKDIFVFQTYTCLSYVDLKDFDAKKVQEVKGMKVYLGTRHKTSKPFTIPILSPAWDILMKYEGKLPIISNVKYNKYLKDVVKYAKINKPVSSHWARHTGATFLLNEGIDIKVVSKICGHSSTKITEQVYAKLLDETVVDAIKKLEI